jgi:alanine or glycine:cation symporter, AGCS family
VPNTFQGADMQIVTGAWNDTDPAHRSQLYGYLAGDAASAVKAFDGELRLVDGRLVGAAATFLNARSVAEDVEVRDASGAALTGLVAVRAGKLADASLRVTGNSLIHSAQLTTEAFSRGLFGDFGRTIVAVALLLFAFSTAIAWSYYGDRAMVYLFGLGSVKYYHLVYVVGFFLASFSDTTLIWNLASVAVVLMTLPNLLGLVLLRREIKDTLRDYLAKDGGK